MSMKKDPIANLVQGLDPIDWGQMPVLANVPPERRINPALQAQAFLMAVLRGTLQKRFPELSLSGFSDQEIQLQVVNIAAARLGNDTLHLWNELLERANWEVQSRT